MSDEGMSGDMLAVVRKDISSSGDFGEVAAHVAAALITRLDAAERERDALREALDSIAVYGDDTLSGPVSEAAYRHWHRDGVRVMRDRARAALTANHSAPVVEE